ncbi:condensation domain-containing protein [Tenacibaculum agarivorans]|uniref:condensation domain-containing protein n=1 Tax=Tenacibaculum agarivorans TaxID=1908389 RepID=UPI00094BBCDD|nr:condensation domain-containing protein [Tenacibaculum agarivorans]
MKFQRLKTSTALRYLEINKQTSGRKYWGNILTSNHEKTVIAQDLPFVKEISLKEENFKLKEELEQKVSVLAKNNEDKIFIIYATLFTVLLHKFTNTTLVSFGIPNVDCKGEYSPDNLIMKTKLSVNTSVRDLLNSIKDQWLTSRQYEGFPLEVYEENDKLFDAFFSYTRKENSSPRDYNFNFLLCRTNDQTSGKVIYNEKAYSKKKITSIINYFEHFIEILLNDLDQKISDLEVILPEEKELLFNTLNNSYVPLDHEKLFLDFFKEIVEKYPNSIASKDELEEISYKELDEESNKVAHFLIDKGIKKGDRVVIIDDRSTRFLIILLGILKSGGVFIALDVDEPIQRAITIIQDTGADFLFTNNEVLSQKNFIKELVDTTTIQQIINTEIAVTDLELNHEFNTYKAIKEVYQNPDFKLEKNFIAKGDKGLVLFSNEEEALKTVRIFLKRENIQNKKVGIVCEDPILELALIIGLRENKNDLECLTKSIKINNVTEEIERGEIEVLLTTRKFLNELDAIFWKEETLEKLVLIDQELSFEREFIDGNKEIFDSLAQKENILINDYGWYNSFNGESFSEEEMLEYIDNIDKKLSPYLSSNSRVLEIGCGQGLVYNRLINKVGYYLATDPSPTIIAKNQAKATSINNLSFEVMYAHEIDQIKEKFDVVVCSSVTDYFPSTAYLEEIISSAITLIEDKGVVMFDDVLDLELKNDFIEETILYKKNHPEAKTKSHWESDLFVHKAFFDYLSEKYNAITTIDCRKKIGSIENELTKYRYDIILKIDKSKGNQTEEISGKKQLLQLEEVKINTIDLKASSELAVTKNIFSSDIIEDYHSTPVDVKIEADDICYLIYSSGTTGKPKGIKLHHLGMINHFIGLADVLKMSQKDSLAQTALCSFDIFVVQTLLPLIRGGKVLFVTKDTLLQPVDFFETLIKEKVTIIELVPSLIKTLLSELTPEIANQMNALRHLISCGEQLTTELTSAWFSYFPEVPIANAYGPAEASDDVTAHVVNSVDTAMKIVPIGKPLDNVCMYTLDEFGQLAPLGVPGELCISGIAVGKGYLNEPEKTKKVFIPNTFINDIKIRQQDHKILYKTGDLGVWHSEGYITFKGRKDFMVKIRGVRIELAEVEIALAKHQAIQDVFVTDYNHHGEKVLCAYYQTTISVTKKELNAFLKERLPSAMIPSFFVELESVPYTKNGKIDRKKLPSPIQKEDVTTIDRNDELENELLNIWAKILQIDNTEIGKESDFFYLGGHSLLAVRLVASIKKVFNVDIALDEIFTYSTFEELVAQIRTGEKQKELIIPKVHKKEFYQVSPPQRRFYIHNQIYPNDLSYNSPQYYKVKGRLDLKKVRAAFLELIATHEILRTSFQLEENLPVQIIHDKVPFELGYSKDEEENIQSHIDTFVQPFNLGVAPLFRVSIVECESEEFYLLFDLHHIISDEISDSIIVSDFLKAYAGKPLLKPEISYKDYAEWFNTRLLKGEYIKHEEYWLDQFHTIPSKLSLPYDIQETIDQEKFGKDITYTIEGDEIQAIKTLLKENRATAFMFFLAVFNIQLKRLSFNEDIAVGSPVSGRDDQSLNNVVGLFLNLIVLRNKVSEDKSFISFLEQVKHNSINALKYQTYPFDLLTAKLGIQGETNETPLYNVMFAHLMKNEGIALAEGNVEIKAMDIAHNTAKADIQLTIYEGDSDFDIFLTVNTNLFSEKTAIALLENYKSVLKLCVENPEIRISEIPLPIEFDFMKKTTNLDRYKLTF